MAVTLTVGGHDITALCPVDIAPIRWQAAGPDAVGSISWTMEDDGTLDIEAGDIVTLVAEGSTVASGPLLNMRHRRGVGDIAYVDCEAAGWGWYLDRRVVAQRRRRRRPTTDQAAGRGTRRGVWRPPSPRPSRRPPETAAAHRSTTDACAPALDTVVEWAERADSTAHPRYFVDEAAGLWWYNGDSPPTRRCPGAHR